MNKNIVGICEDCKQPKTKKEIFINFAGHIICIACDNLFYGFQHRGINMMPEGYKFRCKRCRKPVIMRMIKPSSINIFRSIKTWNGICRRCMTPDETETFAKASGIPPERLKKFWAHIR